MPLSNYDSAYGGKPGSAREALSAMRSNYGAEKGTKVFYATAAKHKKVKRRRRKVRHARG